jgi:hypothetical protein
MATKKHTSRATIHSAGALTDEEFDALTLELERIDALAEMGFDEHAPTTTQTAFTLIQERAARIKALLDAAENRSLVGLEQKGSTPGGFA